MNWYEEEVQKLEKERSALQFHPKTLFYGSSSIRLWSTLKDDFAQLKPINLGFGGSTLAACVWFFDRLVAPFEPEMLVVYAGDNDIGDGRNAQEVHIFFQQLMIKIRNRYGDIPVFYISIKPSLKRKNLTSQIRYANALIAAEAAKDENLSFIDIFSKMLTKRGEPSPNFFLDDGLHLNAKGYELWRTVISLHIDYFFKLL
jgi:lysophospholipase L1-like esterase